MDNQKQIISKFIKGELELITSAFDEYYFIIPEGAIKPVVKDAKTYNVGDTVKLKGDTFSFQENFNIIDLYFKLVAMIREGKFYNLVKITEFEYDSLPAYNMMGFYINLTSNEDYQTFLREFTTFNLTQREKLAAFANKWIDIGRNKKIGYL
jgi:hypothetical protein